MNYWFLINVHNLRHSEFRQGDPTHKPDPTFATVLAIPPHPEYPSLHSSNAGSWGIVLAKFLGISITEKIKPFIVNTEGYFLPPRTYNTINDVLVEIGISRFVYVI
jgi:membrane-associated phospholipid phosphatase